VRLSPAAGLAVAVLLATASAIAAQEPGPSPALTHVPEPSPTRAQVLETHDPEPSPARAQVLESLREAFTLRGDEAALRVGGLFAADVVAWDRRNERHSGLEGGDVRPRFDLQRKSLRLFVEGDLLGDDAPHPLSEAWYSFDAAESVRLTAGFLRIALGTEFATPEEDLPLVGTSFTSQLDGRRDVGLRAEGTIFGGLGADGEGAGLWWQATAAGGHGYGLEGKPRQSGQYSLRLVADSPGIPGLYAGGGFASLASFDDPVELTTPLGSTVFTTPDLDGSGGRWMHLEAGYARGPLAAGLEVIRGSADEVPVAGGGDLDMDQLTAWTASLGVSLTGERRGWREGAWTVETPRRGGAWEIGLRYSNADVDRNLFRAGYAHYDPSTQEVRTFSAVLGWRPAEGVRVALGWVKTISDDTLTVFGGTNPDHPARAGGDGRDSSYVLRLEIAF